MENFDLQKDELDFQKRAFGVQTSELDVLKGEFGLQKENLECKTCTLGLLVLLMELTTVCISDWTSVAWLQKSGTVASCALSVPAGHPYCLAAPTGAPQLCLLHARHDFRDYSQEWWQITSLVKFGFLFLWFVNMASVHIRWPRS